MSIYTKTGDKGETSLYTGQRVKKSSLRVTTYGTVDELDSALGMARAFCTKQEVLEKIHPLQKQLYLLMADLASLDQSPNITSEQVARMEQEMDEMERSLPPLREFLVPGATKGGAILDLARTIARRAERYLCELSEQEKVHEENRLFLNRVSDYCFLLMRVEES